MVEFFLCFCFACSQNKHPASKQNLLELSRTLVNIFLLYTVDKDVYFATDKAAY